MAKGLTKQAIDPLQLSTSNLDGPDLDGPDPVRRRKLGWCWSHRTATMGGAGGQPLASKVALCVQMWPSGGVIQGTQCLSTCEDGLLRDTHTAHTVSERRPLPIPCCLCRWSPGDQSQMTSTCRMWYQPARLAYRKWENKMLERWTWESKLALQKARCWYSAVLRGDGCKELQKQQNSKMFVEPEHTHACLAIPVQARNGLVQWQALGMRKPLLDLGLWDV